jgi:hypothetical protein
MKFTFEGSDKIFRKFGTKIRDGKSRKVLKIKGVQV